MKIALVQQNYHIGNFEANTAKIIEGIGRAKAMGAELAVLSELSVCGYPPRDFMEFDDFIFKCRQAVETIANAHPEIGVLVGAPERNPVREGKDLFNSAWLLYNGKVQQVVHKTLLPTYDVFDENRYFEPAFSWDIVPFKGKKLAVTICEDIWNLGDNPLYRICPMDHLMPHAPDMMINLSASPFDYTHVDDRKAIIKANVKKYGLPMLYCNAVGSQTEIVFDGGSMAFDNKGNMCGELPLFEEAIAVFEVHDDGSIDTPILLTPDRMPDEELNPDHLEAELNIHQVHAALVMGIRDYFGKMGFKQAIIASSGGIDSAVTLALAVEALGAANVRAVLMPSEFSTGHSVTDAEQLSKNLGNPYDTIPIKTIFDQFVADLQPFFGNLPFNVAEENIQSRTRGVLVMALANKFNYILLNTSNKSELATGYGTLYGDMAGGLGVLGDCYKLQVYALAHYINRQSEVIPQNIITKPPSAELRPGQKDSDSLPEYDVLDPILYQYIERRQGPNEIKSLGYDAALVDRILRMVNLNEYKRNQFCPIIRVSPKAFGVGRRVPIVAKYLG